MARPVVVRATDLKAAARSLIEAHAALREGIATHAEKHEAVLDARRKKITQDRKIAEGITRNAKQV